jgi:RNA polymerase sigma-70 factor, ECF subfamily
MTMRLQTHAADVAPFESLYRAHFAFAWRALARLGVAERDLADATQDVFVVVYKKYSEFDWANRPTTWIYAICMRVASDRRRSALSRLEVLTDGAAMPEPPAQADDSGTLATDRRALLAAALDELPLEQRAVFTLFELDAMQGDEIAKLLGIPVATVHSRLRLARATVRRSLERARAREHFDLARVGALP